MQNKGSIIFLSVSFISFLFILFDKADLVLISFRSMYTAAILFFIANESLKGIFTPEIVEFWIGAIYLCAIPLYLLFAARKKFWKSAGKKNELSIGNINKRAFMRQTIALYASAIIFILYSLAFLAPFIAPFSPYDQQDFLVTAYQPPFARLNALVLKQPKTLAIPLQTGSGKTVELANSLISDFQRLKTRNETNTLRFINEFRIDGDQVIYRQGIRTKSIGITELAGTGKTHTLAGRAKQPDFVIERTFIFGTDQYGRDILSRVIYGSKISLSIGFLVVLISVTLGTVIGVSSGYFGGWIDAVMMRIVDLLIAFPALFLILIIIATFGNSIYLIVITLSFTGWMGVARIVRSQVLSLKEQEFILAAKSLGLSNMRIIFRHLAPNTMTPVIIAATLRIGSIILTEAGLSFLGLGVQPPMPSWGNMLMDSQSYLLDAPWMAVIPGLVIIVAVLSLYFVGEGLRERLNPKE